MNISASIGKHLLALTAALGSVFAMDAASAQTSSPDMSSMTPPAEWLAYAETATTALTAWLEADTEAASRMRGRLETVSRTPDAPAPLMEVRIWIAPDGRVSRIVGPLPDDEGAQADMSLIAASASLPAPPADMVQPLRVGVRLEPAVIR